MDPISSFSGLASGIQWRDLVDQIIALDTQRKLTPISNRISAQESRSEAWSSFSGLLADLSGAMDSLRDGTAFGAFTVSAAESSTGKQLISASASSSASPGTYSVEVSALATQTKVSGSAVADVNAALNLSGEFWINGKSVTLVATDSLDDVRDKINAANAGSDPSGVTATILSTSSTSHQLILTSDETGTRGVELVDSWDGVSSANGVLKQLGILDGTQAANTSPSDATQTQTQRFTDVTTPIAQLLGLTAPPVVAYIDVNGQRVQVDLQNDTLTELMDKIQAAGGTASLVTEEVGGETLHRLSATGTVAVNTDVGNDQAASQRIIELLGFVQGGRASEIEAGSDASVLIDGFTVTRRGNTISDAIEGVTIDLLAAEPGEEVQLKVTRDLDAVIGEVESFAAAYNEVVAFAEEQRTAGAPLYADGSLRSMVNSVKETLLEEVIGLDSANPYSRPALAGVALNRDGRLEVDAEALREALETNLQDIQALFGTNGTVTDAEVTFINGTVGTEPGAYAIDITQAATVASQTGSGFSGTYVDDGATTANNMVVTDAYTGLTGSISLVDGDSIDTIVSKLNDLFDSQGMTLTASKSGNDLVITGSRYGSAGGFTVEYDRNGTSAASPIGLAAGTYAGLDVAGTIGGLAATGNGQILTGADGTNVEGLSIQYTGTTVRAAGAVTYVLGVAGAMERVADSLSRSGDGTIALQIDAIDSSIASLAQDELDAQALLDLRRESLIEQFVAMEEALAQLQSQGSWLASQLAALQPLSL